MEISWTTVKGWEMADTSREIAVWKWGNSNRGSYDKL